MRSLALTWSLLTDLQCLHYADTEPALAAPVLEWTTEMLDTRWRLRVRCDVDDVGACTNAYHGWVSIEFASDADLLLFKLRWL